MNLTNQHKSILITFFISGTVMLSVFNLSLIKQQKLPSESYYEIEPEKELTEEEKEVLEALEELNKAKAETNKAYNETKNNKLFAQAYKPIEAPEDYVPDVESNTETPFQRTVKPVESKIDEEALSAYDKVKDLLEEQKSDGANTNSTIHYSLEDRTHYYLPTPIYLCEKGGKVVINIDVNDVGNVTNASLDSSLSSTSNKCLVEHALGYARKSKFNKAPKKLSQKGSITFFFISKH